MDRIIHGVKIPIAVIQQYAISRGGELLSTEYINALQKLIWKCQQDHIFKTTFNHVKNRNQWCPICGFEKGQRNMRISMAKSETRKKISCGHQKIHELKFDGFVAAKNKKIAKLKNHHKRYQQDVEYRLKMNLRNRLYAALLNNQKAGSAVKDLGCSIEQLKTHLESKFQEGMTWTNQGIWHIDHVRPLSSFNLSDREEFLRACHYTNLQPLWAKDNLQKGSKNE